MANFVSFANANTIMQGIATKLNAVNGAYVFRGSVTFDNLPSTLTGTMRGYTYNVTNDFTTDARFLEGAGKKYAAGTNVAVAAVPDTTYSAVTPEGTENPSTEGWYEESGGVYTVSTDATVGSGKTYYSATTTYTYSYDVAGNFVNVDGIEDEIKAVAAMISGDFDETEAYSAGDVVVYDGKLYKFKAAHTAGVWDATEADETTVAELITAAEPDSLTTEQVNTLLALLD